MADVDLYPDDFPIWYILCDNLLVTMSMLVPIFVTYRVNRDGDKVIPPFLVWFYNLNVRQC